MLLALYLVITRYYISYACMLKRVQITVRRNCDLGFVEDGRATADVVLCGFVWFWKGNKNGFEV